MSKKESFSKGRGEHMVPCELQMPFDQNDYDNRERIHSNSTNAEPHFSRKNYNHLEKHEKKVSAAASYLTKRRYDSGYSQDLVDKFQQLEARLSEIQNSFEEANARMEISKSETRNNISASQDINNGNISEETKWAESHNLNISSGFENGVEKHKRRSGDINKVHKAAVDSSTNFSNDTCNTMINTTEQSSSQYPNRQVLTKSYLTINRTNDGPKSEMPKTHNSKKLSDVDLLEKSKKLILTLIDKELEKIKAKPNQLTISNLEHLSKMTMNPDTNHNHRDLRMECIQKIEKELNMLKKLEELMEL